MIPQSGRLHYLIDLEVFAVVMSVVLKSIMTGLLGALKAIAPTSTGCELTSQHVAIAPNNSAVLGRWRQLVRLSDRPKKRHGLY
jgi:hypothetical protein